MSRFRQAKPRSGIPATDVNRPRGRRHLRKELFISSIVAGGETKLRLIAEFTYSRQHRRLDRPHRLDLDCLEASICAQFRITQHQFEVCDELVRDPLAEV